MAAAAVLVLSAIVNSTLYVSKPRDTIECYMVFDMDGSRNDTWPDMWTKMEIDDETCSIDMVKDTVAWRTMYVVSGRRVVYGEWYIMPGKSATELFIIVFILSILMLQVIFNYLYFIVNMVTICDKVLFKRTRQVLIQ